MLPPRREIAAYLALARGIAPLNELQQRIRRRESSDLSPIDEQPLATAPVASRAPMRMMRLKPDLNLDMNFTRLSERCVERLATC